MIDENKLIKDVEYYISHTNETSGEHYAYIRCKQLVERQPKVGEWICVQDELPPITDNFKEYIVCVMRSHYPTSTYDVVDSPYSEEIVTTARYDSQQKIWHLSWGEQLNALIDIEDSPLNGDYVTHWMPLPKHT